MPRSAGTSVENNFSRGLITEATAMNYPENSVIETDNCVYLKNGTVLRRNGIDFESTSLHRFETLDVLDASISPNYNDVAISEYEWVTLSDTGSKSFLVTQIGDVLRFFEIDDTNTSSTNLESFSVSLGTYRTTPVLQTDIAQALGNVVVNDALVASLTGTFLSITVGLDTESIPFAGGGINTKAEFEAALAAVAVSLGIIAEIDSNNFLSISALENDITTSFTVGGTVDALTAFGIVEQTYSPDTEDAYEAVARRKCSFSSGLGYLFVVHPFCEPFYVEYDNDTNDITVETIDIKARDFERLDDGLAIDQRTGTYFSEHFYNLYNQGWYASAIKSKEVTDGADDGASVQVLTRWLADRINIYPSNSDIWWLYKNAQERYDPLVETTAQLTTPAPNGHYIYSAFQTNRRNATGTVLTGVDEKSSGPHRPSSTAFFSSRVWYAGINIEDFTSNIYFSKLIEDKQDFGKCYQSADPTSETNSDLQEIDGGVIVIPDIIKVTGLVPLGRSLLVFASNGVWSISGTQGGFKANDYAIQKVSESPVDAPTSIVVAENKPFWWSRSGIYTIIVDPNSGELTVENISDAIIKRLVLAVPATNVEYIKGVYNSTDKTVQWLYRMTAATEIIQNYQYTHILVHDVLSKAFYPHTISASTPYVSGAISSTKSSYDPLVNDESASTTIYIVTGDFGAGGNRAITMAKFTDGTFTDWASTPDGDSVQFESYFITGYRVRAELLRKFQANYLVVMSKVDTDHFDDYGCLIQGIWDYNNSTNGRLTREQQVYLWSYNMDYSRRKLKMRGNGYSLQFKFKSEPGKKFILTGWVSSESAANVP
jgi:hypothetical protein